MVLFTAPKLTPHSVAIVLRDIDVFSVNVTFFSILLRFFVVLYPYLHSSR